MSKKTREQSQACHWSLWFRRHIVQDCLQEVSHPLQNLSQLNFNQPHFGLAGGSTVLPQKKGHLWRHSTEGEWWVAQVSKDKTSLGREEGRHPDERKAKPIKRSTVIWSLGSRWSLKSKPYGVTWDGAQVSPSSATPHFQDHHCSPLRETPLWASGLHTSGSPWGILGSE